MADIAALGLAVDSSQAERGALALTNLSTAAKRAEVATARAAYSQASANLAAARASDTATKADVQAALAAKRKAAAALEATRASAAQSAADRATAQAANAAAAAMNAEATSATKAAGAMRQHAVAVNDNVQRMGGSMSGLAAQIQDIGVTAAMGMNPLQIALQQGTQIAGQMEVAMQNGGSAASVFGQAITSLISPVSLVSIALAGLLAVGLQMVDWPAATAWALNNLADVLQTIAPYAAAAAAGLALLYAPAIISGIVQVIALMARLAVSAVTTAATMAAANPAGAIILGLAAAAAALVIFRDDFTRIFGFDIVGAAKTGANFVIGSFVAAFEDLEFVWSQFPNIVGAAAVGAANAVIGGLNAMIAKATELLNSFVGKINSMLAGLPFGMGEGIAIPAIGNVSIGSIDNTFASDLSGAVADRNAAVQAALGRDYLGEIGTAISSAASGAADKLRELAGGFGTVEAAAGGAGRAAKDAANGAKDPWKGLRDVADETASAFQDAGRSAGGIIKGLVDGTLSWKDALQQALSVALKLMTQLQPNLFGSGFFQGILGGLLGFAGGGYTGNGATNAAAGVVHGREYVFNARATARIGKSNLDAIHRAANGYQSGGYVQPVIPRIQAPANDRAQRIEVTVGVAADGNGNLMPFVQSVAQAEAAKQTTPLRRQIPAMVDRRVDVRQTRKTRP